MAKHRCQARWIFGVALSTSLITNAWSAPMLVSNLNFLKNEPIANFTQADTALLKATTLVALNDAKDGETLKWSNPETGNSGEITVVQTLPATDPKCRELLIASRAGGLHSSQRGVFCFDPAKDRWTMSRNKR